MNEAHLKVSMVTTELVTLTVPMPVCRYEIFEADANGNLITPEREVRLVHHRFSAFTETKTEGNLDVQ